MAWYFPPGVPKVPSKPGARGARGTSLPALIIVYSQNRMRNYSALSLWGLALPTVQGNYSTTWSGVWLNVLSVAQCCGSRRWRSWGVRRKPSAHGSHSDLSCRPLRSGFYRYFPSLGHQNFFLTEKNGANIFPCLFSESLPFARSARQETNQGYGGRCKL